MLAAFAGTWAAINFDSFWTAFHKVVFPDSENWLLTMESRMIQMLPSELFRDLVMRMGGRMLLIFLALAAVAVLVLVIQQRRQRAKEALNMPQDRPKTPAEELAAVQGPDMLAVHKRVNMTVSERRKLLEEQERQRQALATPDEGDEADFRDAALDTPVESRKKIEFAPADEAAQAKSVEEDDDYDELL